MENISKNNQELSEKEDFNSKDFDTQKDVQVDAGKKVEESIDKDIRIRIMPKKYRIATSKTDISQSKVVGAVILCIGFLVMIALIIVAYMYFIKPQTETKTPIVVKKIETSVERSVVEDKKQEVKKLVVESKKSEGISEDEKEKPVLSIELEEATTTEEIATTTLETATSTNETEELIIRAVDSDGDGLFDKEEKLLGSDLDLVDSDNDGYSDLDEVLLLYNPINTDKLYANKAISKHENEYLKYSLLYPNVWKVNTIGSNESVMFAIGGGSFINLIVQPNDNSLDIVSWVNDLLPQANVKEEDVVKNQKWQGVFHKNKMIFYLTDSQKENVFIFDYSPVQDDLLEYYNLFNMMINSFDVGI